MRGLNEIVTAITAWGSITTVNSPPLVKLQTEKDKETQIEKDKETQIVSKYLQLYIKSINNINIQLQTSIKIPKSRFQFKLSGCVLSDGKMVVVDQGLLVVMNEKGTLDKEIPLTKHRLYSATIIDKSTVAVSAQVGIVIINIETGRFQEVIETSKPCYGLSLYKGELVLCEESKGICKIQLPGGNITTLVKKDDLPKFSYLASYGDKIYQTNPKTKTVTCYTMEGEKVWEYKDESFLDDPTGITVDRDGNVYVTFFMTNIVVIISSNGKQARQLLGEKDGIVKPYGIYFDNHQRALLVANSNSDVVFLYKVS